MSVVAFTPLIYVEHPLLSPREREVAAWLSTSTQPAPHEIAAKLQISLRTVEKHTQNIYRKLRICQRSQLQRLIEDSLKPRPRVRFESKPVSRVRRRA